MPGVRQDVLASGDSRAAVQGAGVQYNVILGGDGRATARPVMGCACALGGIASGETAITVTALDRFGRELGLAFQMVDDLLGIWGDPAVTGKPAGNDLARRKRSMPVVAALNSGTRSATELAGIYHSSTPMSPADVDRAVALIEATGGRRLTQRQADRHMRAAVTALPDWMAADDLIALTQLATRRDR
jgi:geranylgeranyl diphosphate synthase, type I